MGCLCSVNVSGLLHKRLMQTIWYSSKLLIELLPLGALFESLHLNPKHEWRDLRVLVFTIPESSVSIIESSVSIIESWSHECNWSAENTKMSSRAWNLCDCLFVCLWVSYVCVFHYFFAPSMGLFTWLKKEKEMITFLSTWWKKLWKTEYFFLTMAEICFHINLIMLL